MFKKSFLSLVILTMLSFNAFAVDKTFTNSDASNSWSLANNWSPSGTPIVGDRIFILGDPAGAIGPKIDNDVNIGTAGNFAGNVVVVGNGGTNTALLTVNSGNIITGPVYVGYTSNGITNFNGGTWNSATLYKTWNIGSAPAITGVLNMNGGTIYAGELILKGTGSTLTMNGGNIYTTNDIEVHTGARMDLLAGTIEQINKAFGYSPGQTKPSVVADQAEFLMEIGSSVDITGGKLIFNGDASAAVDGYVNVMGVITGYGDPKKVYWDYNVTTAGKTTVWAQTNQRQNSFIDDTKMYCDFGTDTYDMSLWSTAAQTTYNAGNTNVPPATTGYAFLADFSHKEATLDSLNIYDTTGAIALVIDFWYYDHGLAVNSGNKDSVKLKLITPDNSWNKTICDNFDVTKDQWTHYTFIVTDTLAFRTNLMVRFNINFIENGDIFGLDNFRLIARKPALTKPTVAYIPSPANGNPYLNINKQLSWAAGYLAQSHDVYFGTKLEDVRDATKTSTLCVKKNQTGLTYSPALAYNKTYYWRIDENYAGATDPAFPASGILKGDVWSFKTIAEAPADPNLVGWWKLDDAAGIWDSSGNERVGVLAKNAKIVVDANAGNSLYLSGTDDAVGIVNYKGILGGHSRTIAAWIKSARTINQAIVSWGDHNTNLGRWELMTNTSGFARLDVDTGNCTGTTKINDNTWHHVAVTFEYDGTPTTKDIKLYVNGELETVTSNSQVIDTKSNVDVSFGRMASGDYFRGNIRDVMIWDRALTALEIGQFVPHVQAWNPVPSNGTTALANHTPTLTWSAGQEAVQHDVYFGTNQTDVQNATPTDSFGTYKGRQSTTSYGPLGTLPYGKVCYWRVDEVNDLNPASPWKGDLWKFTMRTFNNIDDFESYDDTAKPVDTVWRDNDFNPQVGGDAFLGTAVNLDPVQGTKSLKFGYDNSDWRAGTYHNSELVRIFDTVENWSWTGSSLRLLSLQVYGKAANGADRLYIALEDQSGHVAVIYHPSATVLTTESWQTWEIPLSNFTNVTLAQVKKLYLGVGTRNNPSFPSEWFTGSVYIDNIRVYPPTCRPEMSKPIADISKNCVVDLADIQIMAANWLKKDILLTPAPVSPTGLQVQWTFDGGDAADLSGKGNNGTITSATAVDDAVRGNKVMNFAGNGYIVMPATAFTSISNEITISLWQNGGSVQPIASSIFYGTSDTDPNRILNAHLPWSTGTVFWDAGYAAIVPPATLTYDRIGQAATANQYKGQWNHWAFTKSTTTGEMKIYLNGQLWKSETGMTKPMTGVKKFNVGSGLNAAGAASNFYNGMVDDFRIYNRILSDGEIATLSGVTIVPVDPAVNLKINGTPGQEIIDYRDFSVLAKTWMQEILWPNF